MTDVATLRRRIYLDQTASLAGEPEACAYWLDRYLATLSRRRRPARGSARPKPLPSLPAPARPPAEKPKPPALPPPPQPMDEAR